MFAVAATTRLLDATHSLGGDHAELNLRMAVQYPQLASRTRPRSPGDPIPAYARTDDASHGEHAGPSARSIQSLRRGHDELARRLRAAVCVNHRIRGTHAHHLTNTTRSRLGMECDQTTEAPVSSGETVANKRTDEILARPPPEVRQSGARSRSPRPGRPEPKAVVKRARADLMSERRDTYTLAVWREQGWSGGPALPRIVDDIHSLPGTSADEEDWDITICTSGTWGGKTVPAGDAWAGR